MILATHINIVEPLLLTILIAPFLLLCVLYIAKQSEDIAPNSKSERKHAKDIIFISVIVWAVIIGLMEAYLNLNILNARLHPVLVQTIGIILSLPVIATIIANITKLTNHKK